MKTRLAEFFSRSIRSWALIASEAFPLHYRCGTCNQPLPESVNMYRYCPHCTRPLLPSDPWMASRSAP